MKDAQEWTDLGIPGSFYRYNGNRTSKNDVSFTYGIVHLVYQLSI